MQIYLVKTTADTMKRVVCEELRSQTLYYAEGKDLYEISNSSMCYQGCTSILMNVKRTFSLENKEDNFSPGNGCS